MSREAPHTQVTTASGAGRVRMRRPAPGLWVLPGERMGRQTVRRFVPTGGQRGRHLPGGRRGARPAGRVAGAQTCPGAPGGEGASGRPGRRGRGEGGLCG